MSQALTSPLRATYFAFGAAVSSSAISGPFGPFGSEAVVMIGTFASSAIFASATVFARSSAIGMSFTVWNSPVWWSSSSSTVSLGSISTLAAASLGWRERPGIGARADCARAGSIEARTRAAHASASAKLECEVEFMSELLWRRVEVRLASRSRAASFGSRTLPPLAPAAPGQHRILARIAEPRSSTSG